MLVGPDSLDLARLDLALSRLSPPAVSPPRSFVERFAPSSVLYRVTWA